ncbi:membrane protein [Mycolicibacterium aromaticivorans JS19b1 = JCM 16368]|uniref:Membrane protein n=1 Tax=Mycolicibacterium aromaticivorans JS19b1 = JCM 16368 TaxID=1440774 RepID=A0A064CNP8_9MYCO|nr:membrane protein [Mycolicibacterium aromaticivorans]KDF00443.1 membrane protein [Mycolicibacterium aromaticivorans JS19b1 = JCM 16368]
MSAEPLIKATGLVVAATGLSHFVRPELFESATMSAFPDNTLQHTYIDGGIETAIGLALIAPKTRKLAVAGLLAYGAYLGANIVRNR